MQRVTVIAKLVAKQDKIAELRNVLLHMVEETHKEFGCINYDLHSSALRPELFLFHENWQSQEHLDAHMQTNHFKELKAKIPNLCSTEPEIELFTMISKPLAGIRQ